MRFLFLLLVLQLPMPALAQKWRLAGSETRHAIQENAPVRHLALRVQYGTGGREHEFHLILLNREHSTLEVIDLAAAPLAHERFPTQRVSEGLQRAGAVAGVNGGYFQPNYEPLGLVVRNGREEHPFQTSKLLTGLFVVTPRGASLLRTAEFRKGYQKGAYKGASVREALQAGPFLIDRGHLVPGLNATRAAERTILLADKHGVSALLITPPVTLAAAGELLATPGLIPEVKIERALNLDGGSSTALWVKASGFSRAEWKRVRNAIAVMPRSSAR